jgi:hypothetical protein
MGDQLITVATFNFSTDPGFLVFKASLEHHDIPFLAAEENTVNANPFLSISVGGIRVMVHEDDVPAAIGIWREIRDAELTAENEEDFGEHDHILDDIRTQTTMKQAVTESKSGFAYSILVAIIIGLLLLSLFFVVLIEI